MPEVSVDDATYEALRVAANVAGVSVGEIVRRGLAALAAAAPPAERDPWEEVAVFAEYLGRRFEGRFVPATARLVVTTGELAGRAFDSPSAAAGAVVRAVNPARDARTNGWRFWHVASTGDHLDVLRAARPPHVPRT